MSSKQDLENVSALDQKLALDPLPVGPMKLSVRHRIRIHLQGAALMCLGGYIIWRTTLLVLGLFAVNSNVDTTWSGWRGIQHLIVLYVPFEVKERVT